jgi:arylsulfatase A-like enzyme
MSGSGSKNLVVILCDQLQRQTLGTYGGRLPTPRLDRLAERSAVFQEFYCATPLCVPTRPSMMTGRWPHAHGATTFGPGYETINAGEQLLTDVLMDYGYHVGYEGIWHVNRQPEDDRCGEYARFAPRGFPYQDHLRMLIAQGGKDGDQRAPVSTPTDSGAMHDWGISTPVPARWMEPADAHPDMAIARNVSEFIRSAPADRPFAAWCSLGGPHPPILVPEPYYSMFSPEEMVPPTSFGENMDALPGPVRNAAGAQCVRDWPWERWALATATYWGFVAFLDVCVATVLDGLEASGRAENTVVIFTCDHGEMLGAHNLYQKGVLYAESIQLPFMVSAPGIDPGNRGGFGSHVDLPPTILDLLDLPPMCRVQGRSLMPDLTDARVHSGNAAFVEFNGYVRGGVHTRGVVTGAYKYIYHHRDVDQLFDRKADPHEMRNLAQDPNYRAARDDLRTQLAGWMHETGDFLSPVWPA